jgi:RimJ/RimL family protein N-acetyltransferase
MLDIAIKYEEQLQKLFADIAFDEKYKFYYGYSYRDKYKSTESTWNKHEFVSIHKDKISKKDEIIGYMSYSIERDSHHVSGLAIMNFKERNIIFAKDLKQFLIDIFEKFNFRKLNWGVYVGNPIEKSYDKMCQKYGGRIVGIKKEDVILIDGKYYDYKMYEIMREDYLRSKKPLKN